MELNPRKSHNIPKGNNHKWWKGGVTPWYRRVKNSQEYRVFRKNVLHRDNYKCVLCFSSESLCVDHIKPFSLYPDLRTHIPNGRTLCKKCHYKTKTYGVNKPLEFCHYCPHCIKNVDS